MKWCCQLAHPQASAETSACGLVQVLLLHKRKRGSLCKPGITHSSSLDQGVVGPVAVPSSLEKNRGLT